MTLGRQGAGRARESEAWTWLMTRSSYLRRLAMSRNDGERAEAVTAPVGGVYGREEREKMAGVERVEGNLQLHGDRTMDRAVAPRGSLTA